MMLRVWACLAGFMAMLGALAAPSSAALRYTGFSATLASRTNGALQAIPATVLRPEGEGPFPVRYIAERRNINKGSGRGATTGGDPAAWKDSIEQVKGFFARYLRDAAKD